MPCIPIKGGVVCVAAPEIRIRVGGHVMRFEDHRIFGPSILAGRDGHIAERQPGQRHPFWAAYQRWCDGGKRVDAAGFAVVEREATA